MKLLIVEDEPKTGRMICPRSEPHCLRMAVVRCEVATAIHTVPTGFSAEPPAGPAIPVVAMA